MKIRFACGHVEVDKTDERKGTRRDTRCCLNCLDKELDFGGW